MRPAYVTGLALWSPGHRDLESFVAGARDESVIDCSSPWVPPRLMRGASRLTRMLGEVACSACASGGADPKTVSTIYTSSYGEIETMVILLDAIFAGDGQLSPMRFKNSVHNSASGLGSIGTGNQGFSTALAAGDRSFEAAMIEAMVLLGERGGDAVIAAADDRLPAPLSAQCAREGLAIGMCLRSERPAGGAIAVIDGLQQDDEEVTFGKMFAGRALPDALAINPAAAALPLIDALRAGVERRVTLAYGAARPFSVRVRPDVRD
ncbi:MAG: beta-ketoacyl synthase chain length factor [Myxococcota bacterium]|nr:beta-ketoacyl synthase chain length factor [Myxococcota bacterium]